MSNATDAKAAGPLHRRARLSLRQSAQVSLHVGRPGRCNPRDVDCLYFSETERVADLEYRRRFAGIGAATEPRLTFFAEVDLKHVVDLSRPAVLKTLGILADDVFAAWRSVSSPTRLQRLGFAVSMQRRVSAIRFPSDACRRAGTRGWNVVIFPAAIVTPSRLGILGKAGAYMECQQALVGPCAVQPARMRT
jgi:RES domain-containing protein